MSRFNMMPKCDHCGRFMRCEVGSSYAMRYSGHPPCPDHEANRCKSCTEKVGPLRASSGIAEWTAGIITDDVSTATERNDG
jgi:hypothetical protein